MAPRAVGPLAAFFAFGAFWGAWGVLLPDVKERSGASVTQLGLALFFIALAALPAMLVTGRVADRLGARAVGPALVLFGIAVTLPGLAGSVTHLALALAFVGAASGALDVAIKVAASAVEVSGGRRIIQIAHALFSAGFLAMVAGRMAGQALDVRLGDRILLTSGAALAGLGLVVACSAASIPVALVGFVLGGAGISVAAPTLFGAAGRGADETERGSAVASVTTVSYLGFLAGPPLIGTVSGAFDLRAGLAMLAGIAAVLGLASASLTRSAVPVRRLQHPPCGHVP